MNDRKFVVDLTREPPPVLQIEQRYDTAFSINDLTTDQYRIVDRCRITGGWNQWSSTIPAEEIALLNDGCKANHIFAPQVRLNGEWVRVARIVPIVARRKSRARK